MKQKRVNFPISFPVTLTGEWQAPNNNNFSVLSAVLKNWLLDEGSLTARLKSHCDDFSVSVIGEQQQLCSAVEACNLIQVGEPILVREVLLYCNNIPQVFARSLLPLASLTGKEKVLANLGEQSLGQVLFNNPTLQRQRLEVSEFTQGSSVVRLAKNIFDNIATLPAAETQYESLWGRRSIFMLENKPLLVAEVFLPGAFAYQECENH